MGQTKIEWADAVWNPITGCTPISEGCQNCYAKRMATRLRGRCGYPEDEPFQVTLHPERLEEPLKWKKPRRIFVCSMGDLFHEDVPFEFISQVFDVMCSWRWPNKAAKESGDAQLLEDPGHTFMILTKRPERVADWLYWLAHYWPSDSPVNINLEADGHFGKHIWFGVTAENQQRADERISVLLEIPAAVKFVSVEPMLGPVDLSKWLYCYVYDPLLDEAEDCPVCDGDRPLLNWVICGGETGPGARPLHPNWVRSLRDQCLLAGVPFFFKQWGEYKSLPFSSREDGLYTLQEYPGCKYDFVKVGKKEAGRLLDGRTWDEVPEVSK